jgi:RND family efflux transporter MFP subunit
MAQPSSPDVTPVAKTSRKQQLVKIGLPILIILLGTAGMAGIKASAQDKAEKKPVDTRPNISYLAIQPIDHQVVISGNGEIHPKESTALSAQVSGEVVSLHPNFVAGGQVKRGDVLFTIEPDAYEAAVLQAEAEVQRAQAALIEEQARSNVAKREAKNLPAASVTDLYLRKPQLLSAQAALKSAQSRLKIAQRDLADTTVRAPYDALVVSRNVGAGQFVNRGVTVAQINNIETAELVFPVAGFDAMFLPDNIIGVNATLHTRNIDKMQRKGSITRDMGVIDSATRMTQLVVEINDPYGLVSQAKPLKFGTYVDVEFKGKTITDVFKLPQTLVTNRKVWVVDQDNKYFYIDSGLEANDKVVMTLPEYPLDGMEVRINNPADAVVATPASSDSDSE